MYAQSRAAGSRPCQRATFENFSRGLSSLSNTLGSHKRERDRVRGTVFKRGPDSRASRHQYSSLRLSGGRRRRRRRSRSVGATPERRSRRPSDTHYHSCTLPTNTNTFYSHDEVAPGSGITGLVPPANTGMYSELGRGIRIDLRKPAFRSLT